MLAVRSIPSVSGSRTRAVAGTIALLAGIVLFYAAGFAAPSVLHNATHDTRHALGLPCH